MDWLLTVGLGNAGGAAVLALVAACAGRLCPRPALVHGLWLLVLLKLVTPPVIGFHVEWPVGSAPVPAPVTAVPPPPVTALITEPPVATLDKGPVPDRAGPSPVPAERPGTAQPPAARAPEPEPGAQNAPAATASDLSWSSWEQTAVAVWLAGSVLWWSLAARRLYRFKRWLRYAVPAPPVVQEQAELLARRLGLARCPPVFLFPAPIPPLVWAFLGPPRLLLPAGLWPCLTVGQQQTVLAHELAHLRRGDHWVRRLELLVLGLYWWHPVAWWARHELQEAEEQCCDAWVVWALPDAAPVYAAALVETVTFLSSPRPVLPLGASGIGHTYSLKRRLTMILQAKTPRSVTWPALALLACGAAVLPCHPTWGQTEPQATPPAGVPAAPLALPPTGGGTAARAGVAVMGGLQGPGRLHSEDLEEAKDDVELLQLQLEAKRAELQEAEALLHQAQRLLKRQEELSARGALSAGELEHTRAEVAVQTARVRARKAQIKEAELRLAQASRRVARLQAAATGPGGGTANAINLPMPGMPMMVPAGAPPGGFPGSGIVPVAPGLPGGTLPAGGPGAAPPGVAPQKPATADFTAPTMQPAGAAVSAVATERRLRALEKKLDAALKEIADLRKQMKQRPPEGAGDSALPVPAGADAAPGVKP